MEEPDLGGLQENVHAATQGVSDLRFEEEDEEDTFYTKDLPKHACMYDDSYTVNFNLFIFIIIVLNVV